MKKIAILTLCLLVLGSTVFAYDLSVGFGAVFGIVNDTWIPTRENKIDNDWSDLDYNRTQFGGFAFFGTRYTEFNFSLRYSLNDWEVDSDETLMLSVGAYAKIPISLGTTFVIFPTIGVDFDAVDYFTYLWFRGGVGLDVFFSERFFLRGQALYGYGIEPFLMLSADYSAGYEEVTPGHGPFFKLGLGWMF